MQLDNATRTTSVFPRLGCGLALALTGCSQLLDASDYSIAAQGSEPSATARPYLTGAECTDCMATECDGDWAACEVDAECEGWLEDIRTKRDPNDAYDRYMQESPAFLEADKNPSTATPNLVENVKRCAEERCREVCEVGQNFDCVGKFSWRASEPSVITTRLKDTVLFTGLQDWSVQACRMNDGSCVTTPLAPSVNTDSGGFATIELPPRGSLPNEPIGYLGLRGSADYPPWTVMITRPYRDGDYTTWYLASKTALDRKFQELGASVDATRGLILVAPIDCTGIFAKQVFVDVLLDTPDGPAHCTDCLPAYPRDDNSPTRSLDSFTTNGRDGAIVNVPARSVYVRVRRQDTRAVVSIARVDVKPGGGHRVKAYPASTAELVEAGDAATID